MSELGGSGKGRHTNPAGPHVPPPDHGLGYKNVLVLLLQILLRLSLKSKDILETLIGRGESFGINFGVLGERIYKRLAHFRPQGGSFQLIPCLNHVGHPTKPPGIQDLGRRSKRHTCSTAGALEASLPCCGARIQCRPPYPEITIRQAIHWVLATAWLTSRA